MFVQVIQGQVADAARLRARLDAWLTDLAPGAQGWLGSTGGVTADGRAVMLARFESAEAAQANSDRPEQGAWWAETASVFDGEPTFKNSQTVDADTPGDPEQAGFVQIMQGRSSDPERARALMAEDDTDWAAFRPDILGTLSIGHDDGEWTMAIYFTSEAEAREGERKEPPPDVAAMMKEMDSLSVGETTFLDLTDPWLSSPG
ncbi:hypothetical protein EKO23_18405 [Nocardioides guangzhouensis]|uniref:ABM domain-containing protein n=1 Tax=Nocardioides guangzhouensis TaxID=2497878 RepID=A0A4Q4Z6X7_9ACTN|nr:hypothetical protein [Nocardioides guangzhouensis]RYP83587.1 hypothetical protein EKO23_18405 [Nocardioides guangzhouensis]